MAVQTSKAEIVSEVRQRFEDATSVVVVDFQGLDVPSVTELRSRFREAGVDYKVIKNNLNAFRYCYQRELQKDPSLSGKITLKFVISKDGSVSTAAVKSSSMNNSAVESCMVSRMMRLSFPDPNGGIVMVSYPFYFGGV